VILQSAWDELRRLGRDWHRLLLLLAPILASATCIWVYSDRIARELPVGFIDQDRTSLSRTLEREFDATPQIHLVEFSNETELSEAFRRGEVRGAIIIPDGLDERVREGGTSSITVWRDCTVPVVANQVYAATAGVITTKLAQLATGRIMITGVAYSQAKELALPLRLDARIPENPFLDYMRYMAPGLITSFLQMCLMIAGGNLLPRGWRGSPHPRRELLGRALPWLGILGSAGTLALFGLVRYTGYSLEFVPASLGLGALLMVASLLVGAMASRFIHNPLKLAQNLLAFNTPAFLLSGYAFPEWAFPPLLEAVTRPLPFSLFMDALRAFTGGPDGREFIGLIGLSLYALVPLVVLAIPRRGPAAPERDTIPHQMDLHRFSIGAELRHAITTPGLNMLFVLAIPLYLLLYGSVYGRKEEIKLPVAVTGSYSSAIARDLVRDLGAHRRLHILPMDEVDAAYAMRSGRVRAVLHIPENLDWRIRSKLSTSIPLEVHADRLLPAGDIQRAIGEVLSYKSAVITSGAFLVKGLSLRQSAERAVPIRIDDHPAFNPLETYGDYMLPFLGALILHQILLVAIAFASARRGPSINRAIPYVLWFLVWMALWMWFGLGYFEVPHQAHWPALILLIGLGFSAVACLGMILGTLLGSELAVLQCTAFSSYPFFFLSGSSWPHEMLPFWAQRLGDLIPLTPMCAGLNRAYRMGANTADVRPELLHLSILLAAYALLAVLVRKWFVKRTVRIRKEQGNTGGITCAPVYSS